MLHFHTFCVSATKSPTVKNLKSSFPSIHWWGHWLQKSLSTINVMRIAGGKSWSLFYITSDEKYVLKSMAPSDADTDEGLLGKYAQHMLMSGNQSLLTKFHMIFRLNTYGWVKKNEKKVLKLFKKQKNEHLILPFWFFAKSLVHLAKTVYMSADHESVMSILLIIVFLCWFSACLKHFWNASLNKIDCRFSISILK